MQQETKHPLEMEMLDVVNEIGGVLVINYHNATIRLDQPLLEKIREGGYKTDVMTCITFAFAYSGRNKEEILTFFQEAQEAGAQLSVSFEAPEGGALNLTSAEKAPTLDAMIHGMYSLYSHNP